MATLCLLEPWIIFSKTKIPEKYRRWLEEEVVYIITPREKEVFLQLDNDRDRETFIKAFWKHRDPTPGTQENEYKKEHYRRLDYANNHFGYGSPKPGWQTDRGRIYIILGEPQSREIYENQRELKDTEIWFYQNVSQFGLPSAFHVVFYRDDFSGDYKLYRPTVDGPIKFFIQTPPLDPADYLACYEYLKMYNSTIAEVSLSLIPGDSSLFNAQPSLASELLLQNIELKPQKEVDDIYAQKFLYYKSLVEVEYSTNYIRCDYFVQPIFESSGTFSIHYAISPKRLSVNEFNGLYSTSFLLNGIVSDSNGKLIYQFEKRYEIKLEAEEMRGKTKIPFIIQDMFPIIPGEFNFSVLLKNTVSKEFTSFEEIITIPHRQGERTPIMIPPLLAYARRDVSDNIKAFRPFQVDNYLLFIDPQNIFLPSDKLIIFSQIINLNEPIKKSCIIRISIKKNEEVVKSIDYPLANYLNPENKLNILEEMSLQSLPPAHYCLEIQVLDTSGKIILSSSKFFSITASSFIPRPLIKANALPKEKAFLNNFIIGLQFFNAQQYQKALPFFIKAHSHQPNNPLMAAYLGKTYFLLNQIANAESIFEPFINEKDGNYEIYFYAALTAKKKLNYRKALRLLQETINKFGVNTTILNHIGDCHLALNEKSLALAAWQKSIELNPDQPQIKDKINNLTKK